MKPNRHFAIFAACSAVKAEPSTNATWFQTFPPYGRYPVGGTIPKADKDAEYVFDEEAAKNIIENFRAAAKKPDWPGILVDEEHFSLAKDKSTGALAWAKDIRQEDDGSIWTRWEFTARGRELWNDKILVNRSPAFYSDKISDKVYRPSELKSIGMTNTPHFEELSTLAAARAAEVNNQENKENQMNKIITELGLAEGASEDDVVAAIKGLKNKASAAEAKATEEKGKADKAEAKCREMECDKFLSDNKDKIADAAACKEAFMKDPVLAKKCFGACKSVEAKPQTVLGAAKKTPAVKEEKNLGTCREQLAALPMSERAAFYQAHKAEIDAGE